MLKTQGHIIKSGDIEIQGSIQLGLTGPSVSRSTAGRQAEVSANHQVTILENTAQFAVLEITCGCGEKIRVRCEYSNAQPPQTQSDKRTVTGENNDENQK